ncbi:MAG: phenylalanine 4-monooxygenase [Bacteroidetes bacterium]|nr:phenylalanine 4-monooxygenase [Bacteroidota bacterium]MBK8365411.1 phenylalanine 4-monooxygenase [Bacteroidota bacterium]MBK9414548.1 phenylalanine 4-monooxygenase [Bacteroidota bacterium]MBP6426384.1 phenylalanine 4-monooxygenase [Bacteroidia bacterium]
MNRPNSQIYSDYTDEDFRVWKILFDRQMDILSQTVSRNYLDALKIVNFRNDKIPDFNEVNSTLNDLTGWNLHVVPNISPQKEFFKYLSEKKFTATCWLRSFEQLDYIEEPDMFHDVFAHVPLLSNTAYCNFFKGISDIALEHIDDPKAIELLGRIYWFTIEFGLIRENDKLKIYGAGIISSNGETKHCLSNECEKLNFDVNKIMSTDFRTDILQDKYFVIDSFDQLYNALPEIRKLVINN